MTNRLHLGYEDKIWLLADSVDVKDLLENLSEAAKTGAVVETSVRRSSNSTTDTSLVINPAVIPYWFVDESQPQRVGRIY